MPLFIFIAALILFNTTLSQNKFKLTPEIFGALEARHIGPAAMSGRISAIDAVNSDHRIVYAGAASGGLWKSTNCGTTFKPVFDKYNQSIGSVSIDQDRPDTIWVGTGECWVRNSVSVGDGIYKSTDAGASWKNMGLQQSERIAKILINPNNPDIVYTAVMGHLWNANTERGVYKTTDGGNTWEKTLFVNDLTGCCDMAMDPQNPEIIYAAMWEYYRKPYIFNSGGKGSGLFKSTNGGKSWEKLSKGLPGDEYGRIAVSVSRVNPDIVFALVESERTGLFRSEDKGENWTLVSTASAISERPFYFSLIITDPVEVNRIYKPGTSLVVSNDGGKTFSSPFVEGGNVHSDLHALWIDPKNNNFLYLGTDGGMYVSEDRGSTWRFIQNLPVSQFYHVSVDMNCPYNVYGGLQDNGSWFGPSENPGGITNSVWKNVGYGDGFNVIADRTDDNILYWQFQGGNINRFYNSSRETKEIKPQSDNAKEHLRYNWNTPIVFSPGGKNMYVGAQYLFRSTNKGDTWQKISPDLTKNDPVRLQQEKSGGLTLDNSTAENNCTIFTISESPMNESIVWAGTDDGNLQVTTDGGISWKNTSVNIKELPAGTWCSYVEASRFGKGTAYAAFDGHREGDMKPYLFRTVDFGMTWQKLSSNEVQGFCHVIKEDPENENLLFLGTENGLFVSVDKGESWTKFTSNMPNVPVNDMVIHPLENDLILATHGRGVIIIDDISPLRELTPQVLESELTILSSRDFIITNPKITQGFPGDQEFVGKNPVEAAFITYYMNKRHVFGDMTIEIYNSDGEKIQTIPAGKRKGINRVPWFVRQKPPRTRAISPTLLIRTMYGPTYPAGEYSFKILKGEKTFPGKINLIYDPLVKHSNEDRDQQYKYLTLAYNLLEELEFMDKQMIDLKEKLLKVVSGKKEINIQQRINSVIEYLNRTHTELVATNPSMLSGEIRLREKIGDVYGGILNYQGRPTDSQIDAIVVLQKEFENIKSGYNELLKAELPVINMYLKENGEQEIKIEKGD